MSGTILGRVVDINIGDAEATYAPGQSYGDGGVAIRITDPNNTSIGDTGIDIGMSSLLSTGASINVSSDGIDVILLCSLNEDTYGGWGIGMENGYLNVDLFEGNHFKGAYSLQREGDIDIQGSFDVYIAN